MTGRAGVDRQGWLIPETMLLPPCQVTSVWHITFWHHRLDTQFQKEIKAFFSEPPLCAVIGLRGVVGGDMAVNSEHRTCLTSLDDWAGHFVSPILCFSICNGVGGGEYTHL